MDQDCGQILGVGIIVLSFTPDSHWTVLGSEASSDGGNDTSMVGVEGPLSTWGPGPIQWIMLRLQQLLPTGGGLMNTGFRLSPPAHPSLRLPLSCLAIL